METALVLVLDDSKPFDEIRREFDAQTVASGIPFHISLLYPFASDEELTDEMLTKARVFFAGRAPFTFELTRIAAWPRVVYALPEPDTELRACMEALHALFPEWPPYGGAFENIYPHATLAADADARRIQPEIERRLGGCLPWACRADSAMLLEEYEPDRWRARERLPFEARQR
jgi:2'-5' RNA ligase